MVALYGKGMHDFVIREIEVGYRVAIAEDMEWQGFGVWIDLSLMEHEKRRQAAAGGTPDDLQTWY